MQPLEKGAQWLRRMAPEMQQHTLEQLQATQVCLCCLCVRARAHALYVPLCCSIALAQPQLAIDTAADAGCPTGCGAGLGARFDPCPSALYPSPPPQKNTHAHLLCCRRSGQPS